MRDAQTHIHMQTQTLKKREIKRREGAAGEL